MAKELDKVIQVGDDEYNINAVNADHATNADLATSADSAAKVQNSLIINRQTYYNTDGTPGDLQQKASFDGSTSKSINLVTADDGGAFKKRIEVPTDTRVSINDAAVLNYGDLKTLLFDKLKNHSANYTWNGSILSGGNGVPAQGQTLLGVCIITGSEEHRANFGRRNVITYKIPAYLYISFDNGLTAPSDEDPCYIYFGIASEPVMYCLATKYANNAHQADAAYTAVSIISTEDPSLDAYNHANLKSSLDNLLAQITALTKNTGYTAATAAKAIVVNGTQTITGTQLSNRLNNLDNDYLGLQNGTISAYTADRLGGFAASDWQRKILTGTIDPNSSTANATIKNAPTGSIYIRYST